VSNSFAKAVAALAAASSQEALDRLLRSSNGFTLEQAATLAAVAREFRSTLPESADEWAAPPLPEAAPPAVAGPGRLVEVIAANEREYSDSGLVVAVTVQTIDDGDPLVVKGRFPQARAVALAIFRKAIGAADGEQPADWIGRRCRAEIADYIDRQGVSRPSVAKWHPEFPPARKPRASTPRKPRTADREDIGF